MAEPRMNQESPFLLNSEELAQWVQAALPNLENHDISPIDAKKLAKKIIKLRIVGENLMNDDIIQLFPYGWKTELVTQFAEIIYEIKACEIINDTQQLNMDIPQTFDVAISGIGYKIKTMTVNKSWTFQSFKERLYESEIAELPRNQQQKQKVLTDFCIVGTQLPSKQHYQKTLEELGWERGKHVTIVREAIGGGGDLFEEKKIDIEEQINQEIQRIKGNSQQSRANVYKLAKQTYKTKGTPIIIDTHNTLNDVIQNSANYKNVALPLTLAQDKDFSTWNEQLFKQEFSNKFNIPIECIEIVSVKAGSIIIDLKLKTHANGNQLKIPIECIAENISTEKAKKALIEFGIFAMEFGEPVAGFDCLKQRVIMNPKWNREYGTDYTHWTGALKDGKSRGNEPYYCPSGWKRFSVQFSENAYNFESVYDKWPIAYHGTKFGIHMMITLSGLRCSGRRSCWGTGVYLSPSIKYVSHPTYCLPHKLDLQKAKQAEWTSEHINEFSKYDGKWIQCAFACRVKPGTFKKYPETMCLGHDGKFDNINKKEIEWVVHGNDGEIIGSDKKQVIPNPQDISFLYCVAMTQRY